MGQHERPTIIALAGKPGSGKSTLGRSLAEHPLYADHALHISFGEEVRRVGHGDWMMEHARDVERHLKSPDRYELLDDTLAHEVAVESLRRHRWRNPNASLYFIDGYPRRLSQVSDLQTIAAWSHARIGGLIHTEIDDATSITRQLKRGNRMHHDDAEFTEDDAMRRLEIYHEYTPTMLSALQRQQVIVEHINTSDSISSKAETLNRALGAVGMMLLNTHTTWDYNESPA